MGEGYGGITGGSSDILSRVGYVRLLLTGVRGGRAAREGDSCGVLFDGVRDKRALGESSGVIGNAFGEELGITGYVWLLPRSLALDSDFSGGDVLTTSGLSRLEGSSEKVDKRKP